jgi:hypothetical protein
MALHPTNLFQGVFNAGYSDSTGFKASFGQGASVAVQGTNSHNDSRQTANCFVCTSQDQINRSMNLNANVGINYSLSSMQATLAFFNGIRASNSDVVIIVASTQQSNYSGTSFTPRSDIQYFDRAKGITDRVRFIQIYGNAFVSEITTGGRFFAYFKVTTSATSTQQQVVNQLAASLGGAAQGALSASVAGSLKTSIEALRQRTHIDSSYTVIGGQNVTIPNDGEILNFALRFASMSLTAPEIIALETGDYKSAGIS